MKLMKAFWSCWLLFPLTHYHQLFHCSRWLLGISPVIRCCRRSIWWDRKNFLNPALTAGLCIFLIRRIYLETFGHALSVMHLWTPTPVQPHWALRPIPQYQVMRSIAFNRPVFRCGIVLLALFQGVFRNIRLVLCFRGSHSNRDRRWKLANHGGCVLGKGCNGWAV